MELEACFMDDWDLEAIVRGYGAASASTSTIINHPNPHQYSFSEQDKVLIEEGFPEFSETTNFLFDDLEDLCKPFYPLSSCDTILTTSLTIPQEVKAKASEKIASQDLQVHLPSKCKTSKKKKKNKSVVKKVVKEVDSGFGDAWSWRKYGQKPIKGSPYPRSYYKCSSSKGCLARKQVERSHLDPKVFLVTYTASEHNHSQPIRRNSLAGSTRKNNSSLLITPSTSSSTQQTCSSPLLVASSNNVEDEDVKMVQQSKEMEKEDDDLLEWLNNIADDDDHAGLCDGWIPTNELEEFIGLN